MTTATSSQNPVAPLWMLALLTLSGTLAMHIFVPALPLVVESFGTTTSAAQLTLSAYIVGLSLAQIAYGPIADRFGRRPVLVAGMVIYAAAGISAFFASTIGSLIVARFFEALGGGAGLVLGRAMVRDGNSGAEAARKLSLMNLMVMAGPGLSPLIGAMLAAVTGWRSIFAVLCLLGLVNLALIWTRLPKTAAGEGRDMGVVMRSYGAMLKSRGFLGYAIGGGLATTAVYAFIAAAPFIFIDQLHRPAGEVGLYLALNIVGTWLGSLTASRLAGRVRMGRLLVQGNLLSCLGAAIFLAVVLGGHLTVASAILPMMLLSFGAGIASPMALSEALSIDPAAAGSASGLYGFAQMAIGAICAALSGIGSNPALSAGIVLLSAGALAQLAFWIAQRPQGEVVR
ncbi:multidrug effflux MFS transporter [Paracoccus sp. N5]|uniref:multidrug effflux MFS transporter n=1 Tax=Paracoccus sp. N5 TaxID=1101189 RepID=UPI0003A6D837|nr:multidrug effflux MFS transporter [Paracoccus sp. N5]